MYKVQMAELAPPSIRCQLQRIRQMQQGDRRRVILNGVLLYGRGSVNIPLDQIESNAELLQSLEDDGVIYILDLTPSSEVLVSLRSILAKAGIAAPKPAVVPAPKPAPKPKPAAKIEIVEEVSVSDEPERARDDEGHFVADDPDTPEVDEAWEGGDAPEKSLQDSVTMELLKKTLVAVAEYFDPPLDTKGQNKAQLVEAIHEALDAGDSHDAEAIGVLLED